MNKPSGKASKMVREKRYLGIYSRISEGERLHKGKPDVCYYITFKKDSRLHWEKCGWASEGYSAKLASQIRAERLRSIRHGEDLPKEKAKIPLFSEAAGLYLKWAEENKRDRNDQARYENHLKAPFKQKRLTEISPFDLEKIKSDLFKKDLSPATVRHVLQFIRAVYNKMINWGKYSGENPTKKIPFPSLNNRRERFLSFEESQILLDKLEKSSRTTYETAFLSLHTGMRAGEIFKLRFQDLDFNNSIIRVMDPKNKFSRAAFMTDQVRAILKNRPPGEPGDLVFLPRIHAKGQISRVSGLFQRTADDLFNKGVTDRRQKVVFHTLRHTFGSWLAIQGTPILTIKELMGHKTLAMTERYAHLTPDIKKEATRTLETNFNAARNGKVVSIAEAGARETTA